MLASLANIEKTIGKRTLFAGLNLRIDRGERVGLIGDNGTGKTTLLRILTGKQLPDQGQIQISRGVKVGYLTQDPHFDRGNTVIDEAEMAFADLHRMSHKLRDLEHAMADHAGEQLEATLKKYEQLQHEFETAGGYAWRHKLEATLTGVGLEPNVWETNVEKLSGGQRSRLALAKLLIAEPDLLLLDEPTNHLDLTAVTWLEGWLTRFTGATLLISHDRYLLDKLATRIVWLVDENLLSYPGNYSAFLKQRELHELSQARAYEKQQADIAKQKDFIQRFKAGQRAKEAQGREKRLNRLLASDQLVSQVRQTKGINLKLEAEGRAGDRVLRVDGLSKRYGQNVLWQEIGFQINRGERIGIVGPNGSGKTTLLRCLVGEADADAGEVRWGHNLQLGYYDQRLDDFDPGNTILEEVAAGRDLSEGQLRNALGAMRFSGESVNKPMGLLSGGERARVALVNLLLDKPNVLLLDEPTNHLDIASREALESALQEYNGTLVVVSHDRYFLQHTTERMLILDPPNLQDFPGTWSDWEQWRRDREAAETERAAQAEAAKAEAARAAAAKPAKTSAPSQKQREQNKYLRPFGLLSVADLESRITDTEVALAECQDHFGDAALMKDPAEAKKLQAEFDKLQKELEQLEEEYFSREG